MEIKKLKEKKISSGNDRFVEDRFDCVGGPD
jgi:hypothetical protein